MPRGLYIGGKQVWLPVPAFDLDTGVSQTVSLAAYLHNPRNRALTYSAPSGLPTGCSISGSDFIWNGLGTVSSGSITLRAASANYTADISAEYAITQVNNATVDWDAPTLNTAGLSFDNSSNDRTLAGYRIYYGTNQSQVLAGTSSVQTVAAGTTIYTFTGLAPGTWHFRVVAYDADGDESNTGASATTYTKVIA